MVNLYPRKLRIYTDMLSPQIAKGWVVPTPAPVLWREVYNSHNALTVLGVGAQMLTCDDLLIGGKITYSPLLFINRRYHHDKIVKNHDLEKVSALYAKDSPQKGLRGRLSRAGSKC